MQETEQQIDERKRRQAVIYSTRSNKRKRARLRALTSGELDAYKQHKILLRKKNAEMRPARRRLANKNWYYRHRAERLEKIKKYDKLKKADIRKKRRERYTMRINNGQCQFCSCDSLPGLTTCHRHRLEISLKRTATRRAAPLISEISNALHNICCLLVEKDKRVAAGMQQTRQVCYI